MIESQFWLIFNASVLVLLILDLVVFNKKSEPTTVKKALWMSAFWISLAIAFNVFVYFWRGQEAALEFITGYLIEESLSVDNLFVFMVLFNYFRVPAGMQRKVLFWGIMGALVLRAAFIIVGVELIEKFEWTIYILGAFLVYTGIKMAFNSDSEIEPEKNPLLTLVNKIIPVSRSYDNDNFFTRIDGKLFATPLFVVVIIIETTDIVFAADSIPAILAVTRDPFIVYTSNVFALLGLRSLYFALAGIIQLFHYIHYGLSVILTFIGIKLLIQKYYHIDMRLALVIVAGILGISILVSILYPKKEVEN
jgi:tellurite resistance protein TerC